MREAPGPFGFFIMNTLPTDKAIRFATRVINQSQSEGRPADAVLRTALWDSEGLMPETKRKISEAVFTYYRWKGWLDRPQHLNLKIAEAFQLQEKFTVSPESFLDLDMTTRVVPRWVHHEMKITPGWARTIQHPPNLWLRARAGKVEEVAGRVGDCKLAGAPNHADSMVYLGEKDLFKTPDFQAGAFEIQDIASQAVGWICDPQPGETWWDVCAGEGGKLLHLSDMMRNKGLIWATDQADWRLEKLKKRASRAGAFNYRAQVWDGGEKLPTKTKFDGILVDAPCSGAGTWQRNPHARWSASPFEVSRLADLQFQLLMHSASALKPGGKLVYSVCTLTRAETAKIVADFSAKMRDFELVPFAHPWKPEAVPQKGQTLWPQVTQGNGMFVAVWKRVR